MNYYDEILKKIQTLITENQNQEALNLVNEELSAPYVPKEVEAELKAAKQMLLTRLTADEHHEIQPQKVFKLLENPNLPLEEKLGILDILARSNLRQHLTEVQTLLNSTNDNELKTALIYLLADQKVDQSFTYNNGIEEVKVNPATFDFKKAELVPVETIHELEDTLPDDYPQLVPMAKTVAVTFYYKVFPLGGNYAWDKLAIAIKNRLLLANGIDDEFFRDPEIIRYEKLLETLKII